MSDVFFIIIPSWSDVSGFSNQKYRFIRTSWQEGTQRAPEERKVFPTTKEASNYILAVFETLNRKEKTILE